MVDLNAVLHLVNVIRVNALELPALNKLPKGIKGESDQCPLARSFNRSVFSDCLYLDNSSLEDKVSKILNEAIAFDGAVYLPELLENFVREFDDGEFPELVE